MRCRMISAANGLVQIENTDTYDRFPETAESKTNSEEARSAKHRI